MGGSGGGGRGGEEDPLLVLQAPLAGNGGVTAGIQKGDMSSKLRSESITWNNHDVSQNVSNRVLGSYAKSSLSISDLALKLRGLFILTAKHPSGTFDKEIYNHASATACCAGKAQQHLASDILDWERELRA
ncbi:hypothetical protein BTVI_116113 [Pitangus sulphuratus]|nr:hypothetical protein BTVI_116113 [Pitangus sulphuratus]